MKLIQRAKDALVRKFLVGFLIDKFDKLLAQLPLNERKTAIGFVVALLGVFLQELPATAPYIDPLLEALKSLPAEALVGGGVLFAIVGAFHKALKWSKRKVGLEPAVPKGVVVARIEEPQ